MQEKEHSPQRTNRRISSFSSPVESKPKPMVILLWFPESMKSLLVSRGYSAAPSYDYSPSRASRWTPFDTQAYDLGQPKITGCFRVDRSKGESFMTEFTR